MYRWWNKTAHPLTRGSHRYNTCRLHPNLAIIDPVITLLLDSVCHLLPGRSRTRTSSSTVYPPSGETRVFRRVHWNEEVSGKSSTVTSDTVTKPQPPRESLASFPSAPHTYACKTRRVPLGTRSSLEMPAVSREGPSSERGKSRGYG